MPETPMGAYPTFSHVACGNCGQLTRIETCYPVIQSAALSKAKFCPLCGAAWEGMKTPTQANGTHFHLVASVLFGKPEPTKQDEQIVESIYPQWDANEYPTFREYLRSLIHSAQQ